MDHRKLLVKYIKHLHDVEGYDFIDSGVGSDVEFTEEERSELEACAEEASNED